MSKVNGSFITHNLLNKRIEKASESGFGKAKWIYFCQVFLNAGLKVKLYEARETVSKYVTITDGKKEFRVRFSNHKPIALREFSGDCDFFVGITHTGVRTTDQAVKAAVEYFALPNM